MEWPILDQKECVRAAVCLMQLHVHPEEMTQCDLK